MNTTQRSYYCHQCDVPIIPLGDEGQLSCPECHQQFVEELHDVPRTSQNSASSNPQNNQNSTSNTVIPVDAEDFCREILNLLLVNNDSRRRRQNNNVPIRNANGNTNNTSPIIMINTTRWNRNPIRIDGVRIEPPHEYGNNEMRQVNQTPQSQTNTSTRSSTPPRSENTSRQANISIPISPPMPTPSPFSSANTRNNQIVRVSMTNTELAIVPSCAICKEDYNMGERALKLPCLHVYHQACIKPWLQSKKTCPVCRRHVEYKAPVASNPSSSTVSANG
ncbi:hypothetical protein BGW37DRAFT_491850 [Umbelopsis sp. PMI_123]|nr:hypothetical protein BGW37DRAFT_491850 [Umbelopsis sp. PMI_123]